MTDDEPAAAAAGPSADSTANGGIDGRIADVRRQRQAALNLGDREMAQEFDALERELYEAESGGDRSGPAFPDGAGAPAFTEADHAPLTSEEASGVFAFLDEVDPDAAATLRADWGGDAAANLGYAHLWFVTQYTQDERDSMVVTPGLVRMAARMGRTLGADGQMTGRHSGSADRDAVKDGAGSLHDQASDFRRRREEAQRDGNYRLAQELDEQERAAWAQLYGDGPIVGHAGRTF